MNTSFHTVLFSLLFAILLAIGAGATTTSAEEMEQKGLVIPEEELVPEEPSSNFWPPVHLRGLRSSNGKPTFIRFGKRGSPSFIRFGRK